MALIILTRRRVTGLLPSSSASVVSMTRCSGKCQMEGSGVDCPPSVCQGCQPVMTPVRPMSRAVSAPLAKRPATMRSR